MTIRALDKEQRQAYFDRITRDMGATEARLEISGSTIGSQPESDWAMLLGVTYDPDRDTMDINLENLDHRIAHPREIFVDDGADGLHSIEIVDIDNNRQRVLLRRSPQLTH